jgi:hypothetical protein
MPDLCNPPVGPDTEDAYVEWLKAPNGGGYTIVLPIGADRWVGIMPLMFHWTMHVGTMDDRTGHSRRYCYRTFELAADALTEWAKLDFAGEPDKWHRDPYTGRRRTDGDSTKEYVEG